MLAFNEPLKIHPDNTAAVFDSHSPTLFYQILNINVEFVNKVTIIYCCTLPTAAPRIITIIIICYYLLSCLCLPGDFVYYEEPDFEYYTIGLIEEIKFSRRDKFAVLVKCFYRTHDIPETSKQSVLERENFHTPSNSKLMNDVSIPHCFSAKNVEITDFLFEPLRT